MTRQGLVAQISGWAALIMFIGIFLDKGSLVAVAFLVCVLTRWVGGLAPNLPDPPKVLNSDSLSGASPFLASLRLLR